ncbi:hypothetical protein CVT24_007347 [Panaeolus cyanescens]|uniref:Uncharacterized protein n=1 Tax=Panaeolus cyanescens TaxID=181874 RepID=A0A409YL14_9AGAR|nr:hypothetical protein CVT24_007347 [Panaeolus cyanescens]
MLAKRRQTTPPLHHPPYATKPISKKKRGRPPKSITAARAPVPHPPTLSNSSSKSSAKQRLNLKARAAIAKKAAASRRRRRLESSDDDDDDDTESSLSDVHLIRPSSYHHHHHHRHEDDEVQFPTFVSASGLSSLSSSSSSSSSSSDLSELDDSDDSIQKEEEEFILNDIKNRKRRKVPDDQQQQQQNHQKRKGDWVIRPRRKSVGASDVDMELDSDATEDDDDEDDDDSEEEEADADAERDDQDEPTLAAGVGLVGPPSDDPFAMSNDDDDDDARPHYVGLATGWSEDEDESTFDADLFFANLSDSEGDSSSADGDREITPSILGRGGDDESDDASFASEETEGRVCPFEVAEGWDGQIVFTNGNNDRPAPPKPTTTAAITQETDNFWAGYDSDVDMDVDDPDVDVDWDMSREGSVAPLDDVTAAALMALESLEEDDGGDTTDEELITESGLPNAKAMSMFCLPWSLASVGSIDPASTVSPAVSPGRDRRRRRWRWARGGQNGVDSPRAIDILEGRVVFWDSDEMMSEEEDEEVVRSGLIGRGVFRRVDHSDMTSDEEEGRRRTPAPAHALFGGPRKGVFATDGEATMVAVIGEDRKGADVPSPHPKWSVEALGYGRGRRARRDGDGGLVESLLRKHLESSLASHTPLQSPLSPLDSPLDSSHSLHMLLSSASNSNSLSLSIPSSSGMDEGPPTSSCDELSSAVEGAEQIGLDDVLDAAFLEDHEDGEEGEGDGEGDRTVVKLENDDEGAKSLSRWDVISVSAFRHTTAAVATATGAGGGGGAEGVRHGHARTPASSADFGNAIRGGVAPLLWQQKKGKGVVSPIKKKSVKGNGMNGKLAKRRRLMMSASTMSSPLVLPSGSSSTSGGEVKSVGDVFGGGVVGLGLGEVVEEDEGDKQKSRKELRRERKLKRKGGHGQVSSSNPHHYYHHTHHHHYYGGGGGGNGSGGHWHAHQHLPNSRMRGGVGAQRAGSVSPAV